MTFFETVGDSPLSVQSNFNPSRIIAWVVMLACLEARKSMSKRVK